MKFNRGVGADGRHGYGTRSGGRSRDRSKESGSDHSDTDSSSNKRR